MFVKKFVTGFVTGTLMLSAVIPMFADTSITVTGNGAGSNNGVDVNQSQSTEVTQNSKTNAAVILSLGANSGKNKANSNTGGDVSIGTGNASNTALVSVAGGGNTLVADNCGCHTGDSFVDISGNGADTYNAVKLKKSLTNTVLQKSKTNATIGADLKANTGKNKAKKNTGSGVSVSTGASDNTIEVVVEGGSNLH